MSRLELVIYIFIICHVNSYIAQSTYNCYKESVCRQIGLSDGQACSEDGTSLVICSNWQEKVTPCKSNSCIQHVLGKADCLCPYNCSDRGVCQSDYQTCACYKGYYGSHCEFVDYCVNKSDGLYCHENNLIQCRDGVTTEKTECPYKCSESTASAASCVCPNNCSGILNACVDGKCECPLSKSGEDCGEINPCFGASGWMCVGRSSSVLCFNDAVVKSFSCPNGCDDITGGCKCLNDCSGNGRCIFDGLSGNATCSCFEEFYGADCSLNNPCATTTHTTFCSNNDTLTRCGTAGEDPKTISCKFSCATIGTYMAKCRCHCYSWHYQHSLSCAEDGSCVCKEGWTGPECWTNVIPKRRAPGFCTGLVDGTFCAEDNQTLITCRMGTQYSGIKCARGCASSPLGNNAACECTLGDNGLPCSGRGLCMDTGTCSCNKGYFGEDCSHADSCSDIPPDFNPSRTYHLCDGNKIAVCNSRKMYNLVYCPYGCSKGPSFGFDRCNCNCGNNSTGCSAPLGDCNCVAGYSSCPPGLSGPDCDVLDNPCGGKEGRICHDGSLLRCERGLNVSAIACTNGCHQSGKSCACSNDCNGKGTCSLLGQCKCHAGWGGSDCSELLDLCAERASSGKFCTNSTTDGTGIITTCFKRKTVNEQVCPHGCSSPFACYCPRNCSNRGQCVAGSCVCSRGWFGEDCSRSSFSVIVHIAPVVVGLALVVLGLHTYYAMKYKVKLVSLSDEHEPLLDFASLEEHEAEPEVVE